MRSCGLWKTDTHILQIEIYELLCMMYDLLMKNNKETKEMSIDQKSCYECGTPFKKGDPYYVISENLKGEKIMLCELCNEEMEERG